MTKNEIAKAGQQDVSIASIASGTKQVLERMSGLEDDVKELKKQGFQTNRDIREIEEDYPLDPAMADDISKAVKRKGTQLLGGEKSAAYHDNSIRTRVFRDIYHMMKREFGLVDSCLIKREFGLVESCFDLSYKKLKKKYFQAALNYIESYQLPPELACEIMELNELDELEALDS